MLYRIRRRLPIVIVAIYSYLLGPHDRRMHSRGKGTKALVAFKATKPKIRKSVVPMHNHYVELTLIWYYILHTSNFGFAHFCFGKVMLTNVEAEVWQAMITVVRTIIKFENGGTNLDRYKSHMINI
ncbi:hypothetical protein LXL04_024389 [Taraxacum kok-saghyz]